MGSAKKKYKTGLFGFRKKMSVAQRMKRLRDKKKLLALLAANLALAPKKDEKTEERVFDEDKNLTLPALDIKPEESNAFIPVVTPYACNLCGAEFAVLRTLARHVSFNHAKRYVKPANPDLYCTVCNQWFQSEQCFAIHKPCDPSNNIVMSRCWCCNQESPTKKHFLLCHDLIYKNNKSFQCSLCALDTSAFPGNQLNAHMQILHNKLGIYECRTCKQCFQVSSLLTAHNHNFHEGLPIRPEDDTEATISTGDTVDNNPEDTDLCNIRASSSNETCTSTISTADLEIDYPKTTVSPANTITNVENIVTVPSNSIIEETILEITSLNIPTNSSNISKEITAKNSTPTKDFNVETITPLPNTENDIEDNSLNITKTLTVPNKIPSIKIAASSSKIISIADLKDVSPENPTSLNNSKITAETSNNTNIKATSNQSLQSKNIKNILASLKSKTSGKDFEKLPKLVRINNLKLPSGTKAKKINVVQIKVRKNHKINGNIVKNTHTASSKALKSLEIKENELIPNVSLINTESVSNIPEKMKNIQTASSKAIKSLEIKENQLIPNVSLINTESVSNITEKTKNIHTASSKDVIDLEIIETNVDPIENTPLSLNNNDSTPNMVGNLKNNMKNIIQTAVSKAINQLKINNKELKSVPITNTDITTSPRRGLRIKTVSDINSTDITTIMNLNTKPKNTSLKAKEPPILDLLVNKSKTCTYKRKRTSLKAKESASLTKPKGLQKTFRFENIRNLRSRRKTTPVETSTITLPAPENPQLLKTYPKDATTFTMSYTDDKYRSNFDMIPLFMDYPLKQLQQKNIQVVREKNLLTKKQIFKQCHVVICEICDMDFLTAFELIRHCRVVHRPWALEIIKDVYCVFCKAWFNDEFLYQGHRPCHLFAVKRRCGICHIDKPSVEHFKLHHLVFQPNGGYLCDLCEDNTQEYRVDALNKHMREVHKRVGVYECIVCWEQFDNIKYVRKHVLKKHTSGLSTSIEFEKACAPYQLYKCDKCQKTFFDKRFLHLHLNTHERHLCNICGLSYLSNASLTEHLNQHTKQISFDCKICPNVSFSLRKYLTQHMRIHREKKPFNCDECEAEFAQQTSLIYHMATHTKENIFKCAVCEIVFDRQSKLTSHMQIHFAEGQNPFQCEFCTKNFSHKCNLIVHMRMHPEYARFMIEKKEQENNDATVSSDDEKLSVKKKKYIKINEMNRKVQKTEEKLKIIRNIDGNDDSSSSDESVQNESTNSDGTLSDAILKYCADAKKRAEQKKETTNSPKKKRKYKRKPRQPTEEVKTPVKRLKKSGKNVVNKVIKESLPDTTTSDEDCQPGKRRQPQKTMKTKRSKIDTLMSKTEKNVCNTKIKEGDSNDADISSDEQDNTTIITIEMTETSQQAIISDPSEEITIPPPVQETNVSLIITDSQDKDSDDADASSSGVFQ